MHLPATNNFHNQLYLVNLSIFKMKQLLTNALLRAIDRLMFETISLGQLSDEHDPALEIECRFISEQGHKFIIYHEFIGAN